MIEWYTAIKIKMGDKPLMSRDNAYIKCKYKQLHMLYYLKYIKIH